MWISVELIGARGAQLDAAEALRRAPLEAARPRGGTPPPGQLLGRVDSLELALRWIAEHAFSPLPSAPQPVFGASLLDPYGVVLTAIVLSTQTPEGGARPSVWPGPGQLLLPAELGWRPAEATAARLPLFAAPAPLLPPASERFLVLHGWADLWVLNEFDVCDAERSCLRWAQVLAREGDRFFGGWVPALQVIPLDAWTAGAALRPVDRDPRTLRYVLYRRSDAPAVAEGEGPLVSKISAPRSILVDRLGTSWPPAELGVVAGELQLLVEGASVYREPQRPPASARLPPLLP